MSSNKGLQGDFKRVDKFETEDACDYVGKPDKLSNLRPIKFHVPENESEIEKYFRLEREKVQQWNIDFWARHNQQFIKEKQHFQQTKNFVGKNLSSDQLSVFYKEFLDKNWKAHIQYNKDWYKKNAYLVSLSLRVKLHHILKRLKWK